MPIREGYGQTIRKMGGQSLILKFHYRGGMQMTIRILIADDQRLFRQSLKYLLEQEREIIVVGEAADGQDAFTLSQSNKTTEPDSRFIHLTEKEKETLILLAEGKSNKEIADVMCVSIETIKSHLQAIYKKLGVKSRTEAAIYFLRERG